MKSLLPAIPAVVIVLGGITLDYYANGGATWISYVLFFGAMLYVVAVLIGAFRKPKGPALLLLPLLLGAAASCTSTAPTTATAEAKQERAVALELPTETYTDAADWDCTKGKQGW